MNTTMLMSLDSKQRLKLYKEMLRIRIVESTIADCYAEQEMRCPVHLSIGQEATEAGACAALEARDYVLSCHRSHGHFLAKGGDLKAMMAELYGKATGCAGGKGGSMHLVDIEAGFLGATPIVGSTIAIAAGVAFAIQMREEDRVVMVFLGDGATETGTFYESVNFASLKNLPIVLVIENNLYSVYSPMNVRQRGDDRIGDIARAHGIEARRIDGNDLDSVHQWCQQAVDKARTGGGPSVLECTTYRWREHCGPEYDNDIGYRTEAEFLAWKERDPVAAYEKKLIANGIATKRELDLIRNDLTLEVDSAIAYAKQSPWPAPETMSSQVYAN